MNLTLILSLVPLAALLSGFLVWVIQRQSSDTAAKERSASAHNDEEVRRRLHDDEERIRQLIAGELAKFQISFGTYLNGAYSKAAEVNSRFTSLEIEMRNISQFLTTAETGGKGLRSVIRHEVNNAMAIFSMAQSSIDNRSKLSDSIG